MRTVTIIIPVYNEKNTIGILLTSVFGVALPHWRKQVIVVDDGSTDGSRDIIQKWSRRCKIIFKKKNEGKGSAVRKGLSFAEGDVILIQDADLEYSPSEYMKLLSQFDNKSVSVVYGARFFGTHMSTKFIYAIGNRFITLVTDLLYNSSISDSETGYKVFRMEVIQSMKFHSNKFNIDQEITAKILKRGYRILEVPITYIGRNHQEGKKLTWRDGITALITLIRYRFTD